MASDLVLVLRRLEEEPPVRPAFADALAERLLGELRLAVPSLDPHAQAVSQASAEPRALEVARGRDRWPTRSRVPSMRPLTWRTALLAVALLLLVVAAAAAASLVIRDWLSAGPAGPQYTDDFALTEVYREPGAFYLDLHLAPDGETLLAMRVPIPWPDREPQPGAVVRFDQQPGGGWQAVDVLPFERLRDPALWDPGTDPQAVAIGRTPNAPDSLSVAPNGDLFLAASLYPQGLGRPPGASSIVVMHPDGSMGKVVTSGELLASGLFQRLDDVIGMAAVASAPDLLWARVDGPVADPPGNATWLFQIADPDSDGDWSDGVIRPLLLPVSVPQVEYGVYERSYGAFVAEPSTEGQDRSRSILLPVLDRDGSFAIYRLHDGEGDGDLSPADAEVILETLTSSEAASLEISPPISPRVVGSDGSVLIDELVIGGLTRASRVSRLTADGVVDIMRALPTWADDVEADREGRIYVATQVAGEARADGSFDPPTLLLYRLDPVLAGAGPTATTTLVPGAAAPSMGARRSAETAPATSPQPSLTELGEVTTGVPRVAFAIYGSSGSGRPEALVVGTDGSGPARLIDAAQVWSFCQSSDGSRVAYRAVGEVPGEPFVWVADADGSDPVIVSQTANHYWCGFPPDAMLLGTGQDAFSPQTVLRHDLGTGEETIVVDDAVVLGLSPDGSRLAVVDQGDRSRLDVVEVATGERRTLAGPGERTIRAAWWAPDSSAVAYLTGETTGFDPAAEEDLVLRLAELDGGPPRELLAFHGREPDVSWSADSARLLLRAPTSHSDAFVLDTPEGALWLIDRASGEVREVLADRARWAGWSPTDAGTFAYATEEALFVDTSRGDTRRLLDRPIAPFCDACWLEGQWPVAYWLGWSPDGSFIGLGRDSGAIAVVDAATGELSIPFSSDESSPDEGATIGDLRWWR